MNETLYNVYDEEGYLIGNGGYTPKKAAAIIGISEGDFLNRMKTISVSGRNYIRGYIVRPDKGSDMGFKWPLTMKDEWDKVCRSIREGVRDGKV